MANPQKIEISYKTIIFITVFFFILWLIFQIRDIIILLFISFILMSAIKPVVDWFESIRIPRIVGILSVYGVGLSLFGLITSTIFPPLVVQTIHLANQFPNYVSQILTAFNIRGINTEPLTNQLGPLTQSIFRITLAIFDNIFSTLTVLVFTFYFLIERKHLNRYLQIFLGATRGERAITVVHTIENRLGAWVRGQLVLMIIIGVASYIGLSLLQVDFALPLALIAGLTEIIPVVGPIFGGVIAVLVALATSPTPVIPLLVVGWYIGIQQLENHVIVPFVMRHAVGLQPVITLIALLIGGRLGGIVGAVLAVPLVVTMHVIARELLAERVQKE